MTTREELIEAMARAMHEQPVNWSTPTPWPMLSESIRVEWRKKATAALSCIEAKGMVVHGWRPITKADMRTKMLLYSPPENISDDPKQEADIRAARPADFTWATLCMPLPSPPEVKS